MTDCLERHTWLHIVSPDIVTLRLISHSTKSLEPNRWSFLKELILTLLAFLFQLYSTNQLQQISYDTLCSASKITRLSTVVPGKPDNCDYTMELFSERFCNMFPAWKLNFTGHKLRDNGEVGGVAAHGY
jgi:hypothetical protein